MKNIFAYIGSPLKERSNTWTLTTTFLDRLAAWYHQIRLAGKAVLTVATTAGSGMDQVHNLLGI